jgi:hypothetical protein
MVEIHSEVMPKTRTGFAMLLSMLAGFGSGCTSLGDDRTPPESDTQDQVTWHQDVAPIVHQHCVGCHSPGGIAPFSLEAYTDAGPISGFMLTMVESGKMPPWSAVNTDDCTTRFDWKADPLHSAEELDTLRAWVDGGAVEGDPDTAAELPKIATTELQDITHELAPVPFTTSGFIDQFVCFVLEPELSQVQWMTGLEFVPSNLQVAHHAVLTAIPPEQADAVRAMVGPDGSFQCTGGMSVPGSYALGVWVPGNAPFEAPAGTGTPLAPGAVMILQMHYHPTGFEHEPDQTQVKLRLQPTNPGKTFLFTAIGNIPFAPILQPGPNDPPGGVEFRVPANATDHTEKMIFTIGPELANRVPITSAFPHMHYVGVDLEVKIRRPDPGPGEPDEECLVKTPSWDFDWQRTYFYDADIDNLPTVGAGDIVEITCRYDNTMANPFVRRMLLEEALDAPVDVLLGEETTNEMCLAAFGLVF